MNYWFLKNLILKLYFKQNYHKKSRIKIKLNLEFRHQNYFKNQYLYNFLIFFF